MAPSPFRILSALHQASREVGMRVDDLLRDLHLTGQEGQLLAFVAGRDGVPVTDLVHLLGVPKSTMTSMLNRLERRGLVLRRPNPNDQRSLLVDVTRAGRELAGEAKRRVLLLDQRLARRIGDADASALHRIRDAITLETGIDLPSRVSSPSESLIERKTR